MAKRSTNRSNKSTGSTRRKSGSNTSSTTKGKNMATQVAVTPTPAEEKKSKPKREAYPIPDEKFELDMDAVAFEYPADFDREKHKPLNAKHFANKESFMVFRAIEMEQKAADMRKDAQEWKTAGPKKKGIKKLQNVAAQVAKMREQLVELGMTEEEIDEALS